MSIKFDPKTIYTLYRAKKITIDGVKQAVKREWITPEQYRDITGEEYSV